MSPSNRVALKQALVNHNVNQIELSKHFEKSKQTINDVIWGRSGNKKLIQQVVDYVGFDFTKYHN